MSNKISDEDSAYAVARLTVELHKEPETVSQKNAQDSIMRFASRVLPVDPHAGLQLVQDVVKSNRDSVLKGGEWFAKGITGKGFGLRTALFNSNLINVPSEVLYAKYMDREFLNQTEFTTLGAESKTYNRASFIASLSPRRCADFLLSEKIALAQLELFYRNEYLPISLSTLSTCLLIEWRESGERFELET